jgi:hypothetical protein
MIRHFSGPLLSLAGISQNRKVGHATWDATIVAVLLGIIVALTWRHNPFRSYTAAADADLIYVYESLLINDGLKQDVHDHTGYLYILVLSAWTKLLALLGILDAVSLSDVASADSIERHLSALIFAGRWLSVLIAWIFVSAFYFGLVLLVDIRLLRASLAVLFAASPAIMGQVLLLRPEFLTVTFAGVAFFCLIAASRRAGVPSHVRLFGAAFFAMAAMMTKLQIIPVLLALVILVFVFAAPPKAGASSLASNEQGWLPLAYGLGALAAAVPALTMILGQVYVLAKRGEMSDAGGFYQAAIIGYVAVAAVAHGLWQRHRWPDIVAGLGTVAVGIAGAQYLHLITADVVNTAKVANFLEALTVFSRPFTERPGSALATATAMAPGLVVTTLKTMYAEIQGDRLPAQILCWVTTAGVLVLVLMRQNRAAAQIATLIGLAVGVEAFSRFRLWGAHYYIFADPWILIAAGILAQAWCAQLIQRGGGRTVSIAHASIIAAGVLILALNVRLALKERAWQDPANACHQARAYLHQLPAYVAKYCRP